VTPAEHALQRERVLLASLLADTPEDRHNSYANRKPSTQPMVVKAEHVYVVPLVTEQLTDPGRLL
jgi:hypothetical protein